jgi:hypothetical protein
LFQHITTGTKVFKRANTARERPSVIARDSEHLQRKLSNRPEHDTTYIRDILEPGVSDLVKSLSNEIRKKFFQPALEANRSGKVLRLETTAEFYWTCASSAILMRLLESHGPARCEKYVTFLFVSLSEY